MGRVLFLRNLQALDADKGSTMRVSASQFRPVGRIQGRSGQDPGLSESLSKQERVDGWSKAQRAWDQAALAEESRRGHEVFHSNLNVEETIERRQDQERLAQGQGHITPQPFTATPASQVKEDSAKLQAERTSIPKASIGGERFHHASHGGRSQPKSVSKPDRRPLGVNNGPLPNIQRGMGRNIVIA
jgi:hypothetical protein